MYTLLPLSTRQMYQEFRQTLYHVSLQGVLYKHCIAVNSSNGIMRQMLYLPTNSIRAWHDDITGGAVQTLHFSQVQKWHHAGIPWKPLELHPV